jgi:hypothetical protein
MEFEFDSLRVEISEEEILADLLYPSMAEGSGARNGDAMKRTVAAGVIG